MYLMSKVNETTQKEKCFFLGADQPLGFKGRRRKCHRLQNDPQRPDSQTIVNGSGEKIPGRVSESFQQLLYRNI